MNVEIDPLGLPSRTRPHTEEKLLGVESKCSRMRITERKEMEDRYHHRRGGSRISQKASQTKQQEEELCDTKTLPHSISSGKVIPQKMSGRRVSWLNPM